MQRAAALGLGIFADEKELDGDAAEIDRVSGGVLHDLISRGDFTGKDGEQTVLYLPRGAPAKRLILVGLGDSPAFTLDKVREASARMIRKAADLKLPTLALGIPGLRRLVAPSRDVAQAAAEGVILGSYRFDQLKSSAAKNGRVLPQVTCVWEEEETLPSLQRGLEAGRKIAAAVCLARDLIMQPAGQLTPKMLAATARQTARTFGMRCTILGLPQLRRLAMGALLGVAQGSSEPPTFSILEHAGGMPEDPPVVVVGKGITFDSGGISLKSAANMEKMKYDMSGAAATLAILRAVADLALPINVVGLMPAAENLPGGGACKPGDILRAMAGTTIEVINTDAEGRLILADALCYAQRFKPAAIIDLATLTGACRIAVGPLAIAMMGTNQALLRRFEEAAPIVGERVWQLPLWEEDFDLIKSHVADMKNSGGAPAGTITAGLFLKQFVGAHPWVHLDIASTAWVDTGRPYVPKGAAGVGVRLVVQVLRQWAANPSRALEQVRAASS